MSAPVDPGHWLHRFTPSEWLSAARHELAQASGALSGREQRRGVAFARRAAGMAMNALLVVRPNEAWGRSYMDHLKVAATDPALPEPVRHAALQLVGAPLSGPRFIRIGGGGDEGLAAAAKVIVDWCAQEASAG